MSEFLTENDVAYGPPFTCCGDEDLLFLRCSSCEHIWIECYECSKWYPDLLVDAQRRVSCFEPPHLCPRCSVELPKDYWESSRPTKEQVISAGLARFLDERLRP